MEEVVIAHSATVYKEVQFETSLTEAAISIFTKLKYKVQIGICHTRIDLHLTTCVEETGSTPGLINEDYLKSKLKYCIKRLESSLLRKATKEVIYIQGIIPLVVKMGDLQA